jgi:hypothetical protein
MLSELFGLVGVSIEDPHQPDRQWTISNLFAPVSGRALGGIRAKLVDEQGFITFVNQRDLELLLDLARPGAWCEWSGSLYPGVTCADEGWFGFCVDDVDLADDLQERELVLRQQYGGVLPNNIELSRLVHAEHDLDYSELLLLLWDRDFDTGYSPDPRVETINRRWVQVERTKVRWKASACRSPWGR